MFKCCAWGAPTTYSNRSACKPLDAIDDAREIGRRVAEATDAVAHDQRQRLAFAVEEAFREHDLGALALDQQALQRSSRSITIGSMSL